MNDEPKPRSIALHLRRTTCEDAFVTAPLTSTITKRNENGTTPVDFEAFVVEAVLIGGRDGVSWQTEQSKNEAHPVQCPLPAGRRSFDTFYEGQRDA